MATTDPNAPVAGPFRTPVEPQLWLARLDTSHFEFVALGASPGFALAALHEAWDRHAAQTGADREYIVEVFDDINILPITVGGALRDGSPI